MTERESAQHALKVAFVGTSCEHVHLHYVYKDGSGKHATVEVATAADGTWIAYCALRRPHPSDANLAQTVKQAVKHGHATAAEAIAAIFDGPQAMWPAPKELT